MGTIAEWWIVGLLENGGLWVFLQETYRSPHSNDPSLSVKQILARNAFSKLGIWSLEAPAGGIKHDENGEMVETPVAAAVREVSEETGLVFTEESLGNLLPGGLHIGGDINTKVSHLFEADVRKGEFDATPMSEKVSLMQPALLLKLTKRFAIYWPFMSMILRILLSWLSILAAAQALRLLYRLRLYSHT